ncbi:hypothetical protein GVAV_000884 [Gurleya vavrai]
MISIQELNIEIKLLVEQKSISLTDEDWKIIKKVVINIIKKNDGIIKKIFPDIYDWLSLDYSFIYNNIESKHYDLYKYFITLFILKKLLKSQNEFLDNSIQSINDSTTNKRDTFDKQKDLLVIRYNFFRVIFPLIELNIFLNYIELFFLYVYVYVYDFVYDQNKRRNIKLEKNTNFKPFFRKKIVFITIFFFQLQKGFYEHPQIPENALLCFCLCFYPSNQNQNNKDKFLNLFNSEFLNDITNILLKKFDPNNFSEEPKDTTVIKKIENEDKSLKTRKKFTEKLNLIENSFQELIKFDE